MWPIKTQLRGTRSKSGSSPSLDIESAGPLTLDFRTSRPSAVYYLQRLQYFVIVPRQACTILKINWAPAATVAGLTTASLPSSFLSSTFPSASLDFPLQQHLPVCLGRGDQNPHGNKWSYAILTGMAAQKKQQNNRAVENPPFGFQAHVSFLHWGLWSTVEPVLWNMAPHLSDCWLQASTSVLTLERSLELYDAGSWRSAWDTTRGHGRTCPFLLWRRRWVCDRLHLPLYQFIFCLDMPCSLLQEASTLGWHHWVGLRKWRESM